MYVDIFFPLTKAIPIMFEYVTTHYQTLQIWIGHDATKFSLSLELFGAICNALPRVTTNPPLHVGMGVVLEGAGHYNLCWPEYVGSFFICLWGGEM